VRCVGVVTRAARGAHCLPLPSQIQRLAPEEHIDVGTTNRERAPAVWTTHSRQSLDPGINDACVVLMRRSCRLASLIDPSRGFRSGFRHALMMPKDSAPGTVKFWGRENPSGRRQAPVGANVMRVSAGAQSPALPRLQGRPQRRAPEAVSAGRSPTDRQETGPAAVPSTMKLVVQEAGPSGM
jgi:hypothetical protein